MRNGDGERPKIEQEVVVGLERVLLAAARDKNIATALLENRERAVEEYGFTLTASEKSVLLTMPTKALEQSISALTPEIERNSAFTQAVDDKSTIKRRKQSDFIKAAKVTAMVTAGAAVVTVLVAPCFITCGNTSEIPEELKQKESEYRDTGEPAPEGGVEQDAGIEDGQQHPASAGEGETR